MGMPRGSRWKRLAIFSDERNTGDLAHNLITELVNGQRMEYEWWKRTVPAKGYGTSHQLCRDVHPLSEHWLMVRRGDWPLAYVIAKNLGVDL